MQQQSAERAMMSSSVGGLDRNPREGQHSNNTTKAIYCVETPQASFFSSLEHDLAQSQVKNFTFITNIKYTSLNSKWLYNASCHVPSRWLSKNIIIFSCHLLIYKYVEKYIGENYKWWLLQYGEGKWPLAGATIATVFLCPVGGDRDPLHAQHVSHVLAERKATRVFALHFKSPNKKKTQKTLSTKSWPRGRASVSSKGHCGAGRCSAGARADLWSGWSESGTRGCQPAVGKKRQLLRTTVIRKKRQITKKNNNNNKKTRTAFFSFFELSYAL